MRTNEERVQRLIAEQIGVPVEHITADKHLRDDLGFDSLDDIELVMYVEDEFGFEIEDERAEKVKTVADIYALVAERLDSKGA